jgi:glutathionyl-hydroquinone reductase
VTCSCLTGSETKLATLNDFVYKTVNNGVYKCATTCSGALHLHGHDPVIGSIASLEALRTSEFALVQRPRYLWASTARACDSVAQCRTRM